MRGHEVKAQTGIELLIGSERYPRYMAKGAAAFALGLVAVAVVAWQLPHPAEPVSHMGWIAAVAIAQAPFAVFWWFQGHRWPELTKLIIIFTDVVTLPAVISLAGPSYAETAVVLTAGVVCGCVFLRRRQVALVSALSAASYASVLAVQAGHSGPGSRWVIVVGVSGMAMAFLVWIFSHVEHLALAEHHARQAVEGSSLELHVANERLEELNRTLEARVAAQVDEIEGLNRLRRFLSTPVADAVLTSDEALLQPHRRRIAVVFCDLRDFTAFASSAQPEEVGGVLAEYFELLGAFVRDYDATVGAFTGDGLMAFFNDPLPVDQPALKAITMATEICSAVEDLMQLWELRGYELGFGVGVAYGYANIGMIGFDGRRDYSALGPVVNLASRLCSEAADGQILIDLQAHAAAADAITVSEPLSLDIKGYLQPVTAYEVKSVRDSGLESVER
jgi:class 3 adenylate cyclase